MGSKIPVISKAGKLKISWKFLEKFKYKKSRRWNGDADDLEDYLKKFIEKLIMVRVTIIELFKISFVQFLRTLWA